MSKGIYYLMHKLASINVKESMYVLKKIDVDKEERILIIGGKPDGICYFENIYQARKRYDIICNNYIGGLQPVEKDFEEVKDSYEEFTSLMTEEEISLSLHHMYEDHDHDLVLSKTLIRNKFYEL